MKYECPSTKSSGTSSFVCEHSELVTVKPYLSSYNGLEPTPHL